MREKENAEGDLVTEKHHRMGRWGYWNFWYEREPWAEWELMYRVLLDKRDTASRSVISAEALSEVRGEWAAGVQLYANVALPQSIEDSIDGFQAGPNCAVIEDDRMVLFGVDHINEEFIGEFTDVIRRFMEAMTPTIDKAYEEGLFGRTNAEEDSEDGD